VPILAAAFLLSVGVLASAAEHKLMITDTIGRAWELAALQQTGHATGEHAPRRVKNSWANSVKILYTLVGFQAVV
jgi:hypothetical protein